jgi:hypothetical protein
VFCKKFAYNFLTEGILGDGFREQYSVRDPEPYPGSEDAPHLNCGRLRRSLLAQCSRSALHRLAASGDVRRIARGLYDVPGVNSLTRKPTSPDPHDVISALTRKGKVRILVDGITAAGDLRLTDAVPARIEVLTDERLRPIKLGNLTLDFQHAAPSRLYWVRPSRHALRAGALLTARHAPRRQRGLRRRLVSILQDPDHGPAIRDDRRDGFLALPEWMRAIVRDLLREAETTEPPGEGNGRRYTGCSACAGNSFSERTYDEQEEAGG